MCPHNKWLLPGVLWNKSDHSWYMKKCSFWLPSNASSLPNKSSHSSTETNFTRLAEMNEIAKSNLGTVHMEAR